MEDPLIVLRSAIAAGISPKLIKSDDTETDDIMQAEKLMFPPVPGISDDDIKFPLNQETRFESKDPETKLLDLLTVYNCYITRDLSVTDYITVSGERGIYNLKFLERTDLITWLEGASSQSDYIKPSAKSAEKSSSASQAAKTSSTAIASDSAATKASLKPREIEPELQRIYEKERSLSDHNIALRGDKMISFESVSTECRDKIISAYKSTSNSNNRHHTGSSRSSKVSKPSSSSHSSTAKGSSSSSSNKRKDPIIILSPSASALLNMSNIKQFLEEGVYSANQSFAGATDVTYVKRTSTRLGGTVKLLVVNSVEKFKPEYWDRVVGVFVTGQPWQLKPYKWSDPNVLFQKVQGFSLFYKGDPVPSTVKNWNVDLITIDRNQRFKDSEVVERIWDKIETAMKKRGYGPKNIK